MGLPCCSRQYTVFSRSPAARSGPGSTASAGAAVGRPPTASSPVSRYNSMYAASFERRGRPSAAAAVTGVAEAEVLAPPAGVRAVPTATAAAGHAKKNGI